MAIAFRVIFITVGVALVHQFDWILYLFGITIEFAQEYSNSLFHSRIHGRYDPEDVKYNLKGLIAFSVIWICYIIGTSVYNKLEFNGTKNNQNDLN